MTVLLWFIWQAWQQDYGVTEPETATTEPAKTAPQADATHQASESPEAQDAPPAPPSKPQSLEDSAVDEPTLAGNVGGGIQVKTDVFDIEIALAGGEMRRAKLPLYPVSLKAKDKPFVLLDTSPTLFYVAQSGFLTEDKAFDHNNSRFQAGKDVYEMASGQDSLEVKLIGESKDGVSVNKIYTFHRGSYTVDLRYEVDNQGSAPWQGNLYAQLQRSAPTDTGGYMRTYTGTAISSPDKRYEKIDFDDMVEMPLSRDIKNGWAAMIQHYFVSAIIPNEKVKYHYYTKAIEAKDRYLIGAYGPKLQVAPGQREEASIKLYFGPKDQHIIGELSEHLELTVDYGVLWFIAKPIYWLLDKMHGLVGNWGWAIILVTITLKILFYYPSAVSFKSMANMRRVQPRITAIRDRYADDKTKLNQAMMELYREEKVNPVSGCLPMLIQIPVFISLYWVLMEAVELRQAPFALWLKDLSTPDPLFVLPTLMGISMFVQQKLSPPITDPLQEKIFQVIPIAFTVTFAFFPSGLVLYWFVNNVLSILQQWTINRRFGHLNEAPKPST
jgi:YidC/Oxa1 family membrane protein insertase